MNKFVYGSIKLEDNLGLAASKTLLRLDLQNKIPKFIRKEQLKGYANLVAAKS